MKIVCSRAEPRDALRVVAVGSEVDLPYADCKKFIEYSSNRGVNGVKRKVYEITFKYPHPLADCLGDLILLTRYANSGRKTTGCPGKKHRGL